MPVLQIIRKHLPDCSITWVADKRFADILDHQPDLQNVIKLELKGLKKQKSINRLKDEYRSLTSAGPFDAVIDLHGMIKSAITAVIVGGQRYGFDRHMIKEPLAGLLYHRTLAIPMELPAASRYTQLGAESLGLPFQPAELLQIRPFLFSKDADRHASDEYFSKQCRNIIMVPETSAPYKNYPPKKFIRLSKSLGENILICHGNQQEYETARFIAEQAGNARVLPRLNLNQLKAAIGRADVVIGGDSGPTHIAWGCGVPSITLFGATPVCILPTTQNLVIKTATTPHLHNHDSGDLSIQTIPVEYVVALAEKLL
jgi:heptosyltransferase-1